MNTIPRECLSRIWTVLYAAREQPLEKSSLWELERLLQNLEDSLSGRPDLSERLETYTLTMRSSGLFENGETAVDLGPLLAKTDELRNFLGPTN